MHENIRRLLPRKTKTVEYLTQRINTRINIIFFVHFFLICWINFRKAHTPDFAEITYNYVF